MSRWPEYYREKAAGSRIFEPLEDEDNEMTEQLNGYGFTEAPASVNFRFDYNGYSVQLTLRDATGIGALEKLDAALKALEKRGAEPTATGTVATNGNGSSNGTAPMCPTHSKPMAESKYGGWYCPVKIADDGGDGKAVYCKQKVKA